VESGFVLKANVLWIPKELRSNLENM